MKLSKKKNFQKFNYKFFTDKWMFGVIIFFYIIIRYKLMPNTITDIYTPFIISFLKIIWTKTSNIKIYKDKIVYHHKEFPTYLRKEIKVKNIKRIHFRTLFFTFSDCQYALIEYKSGKTLLINLSRFARPKRTRTSIIDFCKKNKIETVLK